MNAVQIPRDTENIVLYLAATSLRSAHTLDAVHTLCPNETCAAEALAWLINNGYIYEDAGIYELTINGLRAAEQLQDGSRSALRMVVPASTLHPRPAQPATPTVDTHPLRASTDHGTQKAHRLSLQYVLAFEAPKNTLPVPVLDGDIVGRQSDADISLRHDEYISSQHCRFRVSVENKEPTLYVEDLGSRNGTYVDGSRLEKGQLYELKHGARIHMGGTIMIVVKIPY